MSLFLRLLLRICNRNLAFKRIGPDHCPTVLFVFAGKALSYPAWRRSEGHTHPETGRIVQVKGLEADSRLRGNDRGDAGMAFLLEIKIICVQIILAIFLILLRIFDDQEISCQISAQLCFLGRVGLGQVFVLRPMIMQSSPLL
jgi:hypothetical protein